METKTKVNNFVTLHSKYVRFLYGIKELDSVYRKLKRMHGLSIWCGYWESNPEDVKDENISLMYSYEDALLKVENIVSKITKKMEDRKSKTYQEILSIMEEEPNNG